MVVSREKFNAAGGFDERLINMEDHDLTLKLGAAHRFVAVKNPVTLAYRRHAGGVTRDAGKTFLGAQMLIEHEISGKYPGGKGRQRAQPRTIITAHATCESAMPSVGIATRGVVDLPANLFLECTLDAVEISCLLSTDGARSQQTKSGSIRPGPVIPANALGRRPERQVIPERTNEIFPTSFAMSLPLNVCIGITTYNRSAVLRTAIKSALDQDYQHKEVFVFDDASTDNTSDLKVEFPQVRWHRSPTSQGYRAARNFMMSNTEADLFCSLDDDSWFLCKNGLSDGVKLFDSRPNLGAVGFEILDQGHPDGHSQMNVSPSNMFIGCGHLLKLSAVREVGFHHRLPGEYGGEEKDLSIRLLDAGYEVVQLQGVHVWHDKTFQSRRCAGSTFFRGSKRSCTGLSSRRFRHSSGSFPERYSAI